MVTEASSCGQPAPIFSPISDDPGVKSPSPTIFQTYLLLYIHSRNGRIYIFLELVKVKRF
jgi:hypothetical protein